MNYQGINIMDMIESICSNEQKLNCMLINLDNKLERGENVLFLISEIADQCLNCNIAVSHIISLTNLDIPLQELDPCMTPDEVIQVSLNNLHIIKKIGIEHGILCS